LHLHTKPEILTQGHKSMLESPAMRVLTFHQPRRLVFGNGALTDCIDYLVESRTPRLHIVTSQSLVPTANIVATALAQAGTSVSLDGSTPSEPTLAAFHKALAQARRSDATCILGLGGGSALDVAKLVAAFVKSEQRIEETFGIGLLRGRSCSLICMPTTSGTGSEVSPNAILLDEAAALKKAVISPYLVPDATFIDPELTRSLPSALTASTGLDALAHCVEAYTNLFAHPMVDLYALEGIRLCSRFLIRAVHHPNDLQAREGMALASLYGGLCLGPVNTAAAHALAYPLGSQYHIAHGVSVALLLPHIFAFNAQAAPQRHADVARALRVPEQPTDIAMAHAASAEIARLVNACALDSDLRSYGIAPNAIPALASAAMTVTRLLRNNPRPISESDCVQIYTDCFR
jgi:alcohol dehydrogenase class IV